MNKKIILQEIVGNILRKTQSVCPVCMDFISANIVEKKGAIFMEKICSVHGMFMVLISNYTKDYRNLSDSYFYFLKDIIVQGEYYLNPAGRCNAGCTICFLSYQIDVDKLSINDIKKISVLKNIKRFVFSHGEATESKNLFEIIKILKRSRKIVAMHTNGFKISDYFYASLLKSTGIDQISFQFDGFSEDVYRDLRGRRLLHIKLKALENLKRLSIPVTLNATIARGINEEEIKRIFDYAVKENFIKDISFITYCHYESTQENMNRYIMPDELITFIEKYTSNKISRENIMLFQQLCYAYAGVFRRRKCFYYYHFMVVRSNKGYLPINEFINLRRTSSIFDCIKNKKLTLRRWSFLIILLLSLKIRGLSLLPFGILMLFRGGYPKKPGKFLVLTFATICDPYKYDSAIADNCGQGIINQERRYDSYGKYLIEKMQETRSYHENSLHQ